MGRDGRTCQDGLPSRHWRHLHTYVCCVCIDSLENSRGQGEIHLRQKAIACLCQLVYRRLGIIEAQFVGGEGHGGTVMPYLTRDGVQIYYEDHGQGLPILLSHGFGASTAMWHWQIEAFRNDYRLIPWDMRGHGKSDSPDDPALYSHAHTLADMGAILDYLRIEWAVIAGHSLGGFLSLLFCVSHPERVRALLLQGCGPGYRNAEARAAWNARVEERALTLESKGLEALGGGAEVRVSEQRSATGLAQAARGILTQVDSRVMDYLPRITVPTLIIAGDGDTPFLKGTHYMAGRIPRATAVIIPQAGHGANVEQPEVFNQTVRGFLEQL